MKIIGPREREREREREKGDINSDCLRGPHGHGLLWGANYSLSSPWGDPMQRAVTVSMCLNLSIAEICLLSSLMLSGTSDAWVSDKKTGEPPHV